MNISGECQLCNQEEQKVNNLFLRRDLDRKFGQVLLLAVLIQTTMILIS